MRVNKILTIATNASTAGSLQKQVEAFVQKVSFLAQGGLTLEEIAQIFFSFVEMCVHAAEDLVDAAGDEKKQAVLEAVSYLYDILAPAIPLPWFLAPFRRLLKEPGRALVLAIASGVIEVFVARLPEPTPDLDPPVAIKLSA